MQNTNDLAGKKTGWDDDEEYDSEEADEGFGLSG